MKISEKQAIEVLKSGGIVALPTETVYGLAGNAFDEKAVAKIFAAKGRPLSHPLIMHIKDRAEVSKYSHLENPAVDVLTKKFWPGPLTLIVPQKNCPDSVRAGLSTIALRSPDHPAFLNILNSLDFPLVAPSANPFTKTSATSAEQVEKYFGKIPVVDGGPCSIGIESTTLMITPGSPLQLEILRLGFVSKEQISAELALKGIEFEWAKPADSSQKLQHSPGTMNRHYQPELPLVLKVSKEGDFQTVALKFNLRCEMSHKIELPKSFREASKEFYTLLVATRQNVFSPPRLESQNENSQEWLFLDLSDVVHLQEWAPLVDRARRASTHIF